MLTNKNFPTPIEPGLPQRDVFTVKPMTCGMLFKCWIKCRVNKKPPPMLLSRGLGKELMDN